MVVVAQNWRGKPKMKTGKTFFTEKNRSQPGRPRLAVTLGDPAGIGPEVILKALADPEVTNDCDTTVIGSRSLLQTTYTQLRQTWKIKRHWLIQNDYRFSIFL
jgi:hypothetical protein